MWPTYLLCWTEDDDDDDYDVPEIPGTKAENEFQESLGENQDQIFFNGYVYWFIFIIFILLY